MLILVFLVVLSKEVSDELCKRSFKEYNSVATFGEFCYIHGGYDNALESEIECISHKGHLASIHSQEENDFIGNFSKKISSTEVWFGISDRKVEGSYTWMDGTPMNYTNWDIASGEPNNYIPGEDFGYMRLPSYKWNDCGWSNDGLCFICKTKPRPCNARGIEKNLKLCQDAYPSDVVGSLGEYCYVYKGVESWTGAEATCVTMGGHLPSVHSNDEHTYILYFNIHVVNSTSDPWLGFTDKDSEGTFVWTDGTTNDYSNWFLDEPSNGEFEHYTHIWSSVPKFGKKFGFWNDATNELNPYNGTVICQISNKNNTEVGCVCDEGYFGDECQNFTCFGINNTDYEGGVCGGHGKCVELDACDCDDEYFGFQCERDVGECNRTLGDYFGSVVRGFEDFCYVVYDTIETTDSLDAENRCLYLNGHLPSIHSRRENDFVSNLAGEGEGVFLGFTDRRVEGVFEWFDGSPVDYTNWRVGEPGNSGGEDYSELEFHNKLWNDVSDGSYKRVVCKVKPNNYCSFPRKTKGLRICEDTFPGSIVGNFGQSCYVYNGKNNWVDCENSCVSMGGHLPSIHSIEENTYIMHFTQRYGKNLVDRIWIGFTDIDNEPKNYTWIDGTPVDFVYWALGEPSGGIENYVHIVVEAFSNLQRWNDVPGYFDYQCVCQIHNDGIIGGDECVCETGYFGFECRNYSCYGVNHTDERVCSFGHGNCSGFNTCDCPDGLYAGDECEVNVCFGVLSDDTVNVCSGHGDCATPNTCNCTNNFTGVYCNVTKCFGVYSNDTTSELCSGHGNCVALDVCACTDGYVHPENTSKNHDCSFWKCFGYYYDDDVSEVCSGYGNCTAPDICNCSVGYYMKNCSLWNCNFTETTDPNVCSGRGNCTTPENCECKNAYFDTYCELYNGTCFDIMSNASHACSGHGKCDGIDVCICQDNYYSEDCGFHRCFQKGNNETEVVCGNHGDCVDHDECLCHTNYSNHDCSDWKCGGIWENNSIDVCSRHGNCIGYDDCDCLNLYNGDNCEFWSCNGISSSLVGTVCSGHGSCVAFDYCGCQDGYKPSSGVYGDDCDMWKCGNFKRDHKKVCNERGNCTSLDFCVCVEGFEGLDCETWSCDGIDKDSHTVCSNKQGKCVSPGKCECKNLFSGEKCEVNLGVLAVMTPLLSVFGFVSVVCICVMVCCSICCICIFACGVIMCLTFVLCGQKLKMKKFEQLDNVDILLSEQQAERDTSIAHLKVNKNLFEIDFDGIKIDKILGEGGSDSVVYKAFWSGQVVAFKCFKTRMICQNQDRFDEFEKEVEIFSSISHPNIVRFYGCTMKPPRVGIVMEFCENGEMLDFIRGYYEKEDNDEHYPLDQKIRMLNEVSIGMQYLHERNIIHRDLKCENVLIDSAEKCKLMDFGLSKIAERLSQVKTQRVGTSIYMAPEVVMAEKYSEKCDVFSYGILSYMVILECVNPYEGCDEYGIEFKVCNDPLFRPDMKKLENFLREQRNGMSYIWTIGMIKRSWIHDHKKRPSFKDLNEIAFSSKEMAYDEEEEMRELKKRNDISELQKKNEMQEMENAQLRKEVESLNLKVSELEKSLLRKEEKDDDNNKSSEDSSDESD